MRFILFCDQVRQESNSKNIYIGTYGNAMLVEGSFPAVLASFAIAISIDPPSEQQTTSREEDVVVLVEVPGVDQPHAITHTLKRKHPLDSTSLHLNFVPFVIPNPGEIKVTVTFAEGATSTATLLVAERDEYQNRRF